MDIEKRVSNLENLVNGLIKNLNNRQYYTDADVAGARKNITDLDQKVEDAVFPEWNPDGYSYFAGERVSYNGNLYRCIQAHTSQADWAPDTAVSLWVAISNPAEEWPEWKQPTGSHDAYNKGDKVSHLEKHWISDVDANVWEPGVYGWSEAEG